jgi:hypothetical protein
MLVVCDEIVINRAIAPPWIITDSSRALIRSGIGQVDCHTAEGRKWLLPRPNPSRRAPDAVGGRSTLWSPGVI